MLKNRSKGVDVTKSVCDNMYSDNSVINQGDGEIRRLFSCTKKGEKYMGYELINEERLIALENKIDQLIAKQNETTVIDDSPLTVAEAAVFLKVSKDTVYRWIADDMIPHHRYGNNHILIYKSELKKI